MPRILIHVFLTNDKTLGERRAAEIAGTVCANGEGLYMLSQEAFEKAFGNDGMINYNMLQDGTCNLISQPFMNLLTFTPQSLTLI